MADRFYLPSLPADGMALLGRDEAHHLARVRRLTVGDTVELFDGQGVARLAEIVALGRSEVELRITGPASPRAAVDPLTMAVAVPKGDRFDWLVEKLTELNVTRLVPLITERSVVDPRGSKLDRLRRLVVEACKQCGRDLLMSIDEPTAFAAYLANETSPRRLIAHPVGSSDRRWVGAGGAVAVAVGPEGGFTEGEVDDALARGWEPADLGANLLRVETAAIAAAAVVGATRPRETKGP